MIRLPRQKAGGPFQLIVEGKNRIVFEDVIVGEVWICSGQSNMEWPLSRSFEPETDIANSADTALRLLTVPKLKAEAPTNNIAASWVLCGPETVRGFSAVAYYFGRALRAARGVPVGLIHTSWGGSPAEVWIRHELLAAHPEYKQDILDPYPEQERSYREELAKWEVEAEALRKEGKEPTRGQLRNADGILGLDLRLEYDATRLMVVGIEPAGIGIGLSLVRGDRPGKSRIAAYGLEPLSGSGPVLEITVEALRDTGGRDAPTIGGVANEGMLPLRVRGRS